MRASREEGIRLRGLIRGAMLCVVLVLALTACKSEPKGADAGGEQPPPGPASIAGTSASQRLVAAAAAEGNRPPAPPRADLAVPPALLEAHVALDAWTGDAMTRATSDLDTVLGLIQTPDFLAARGDAGDRPVPLNPGPPSEAVKAYVRGLAAHQQGERFAAINELEQARRLDPASATVHRVLGRVYFEYRNEIKGAQRLVEAVRIDRDDALSLYLLGRIAFERQRWDEAIAALSHSVRATEQPDDPAVAYQRGYYLGQALLRQGFDAAGIAQAAVFLALPEGPMRTTRQVREVTLLDRQRGRVNEQLGDAQVRLGNPAAAAEHYAAAEGDELVDADLLTARRVYALLLIDRPRSAELALIRRLAAGQSSPALLSLAAYVAEHSGRPREFAGLVRDVYQQADHPPALALAVAGMLDDPAAAAFLADHLAARPDDLGAYRYMTARLGESESDRVLATAVSLIGRRPDEARGYTDALLQLPVAGERWIERIERLPPDVRDSAAGWYLRGAIHERADRIEQAADCYDKAMAADAGFHSPHRATIDLQVRLGRFEKALKLIDRIQGPLDDELRYARVQCLSGLRRYDEALVALDQLIASQDRNPRYRLAKADIQVLRGDLSGAEATLWSVLNISPTNEPAYAQLFALYRSGRWAEGGDAKWVNLLAEVQRQIPTSRIARLKAAEFHILQGEFDLAERPLLDVLVSSPDDEEATLLLMRVYFSSRRFADAERYLIDRLRKQTPSLQAMHLLRQFAEVQGKLAEYFPVAERFLLDRAPTSETLVELALLYRAWDRPDDAAEAIDKAVRERSGANVLTWRAIARVLQVTGQTDRATAVLDEAAGRFSGDAATLLYDKSLMLDAADRDAEAEQALLKALQIDPDHAPANNNLAYLYAEQSRELDRARQMAERAVKAQPEQGAYIDTLAWVHYKLGDFAEAVRQLELARGKLDGRAEPVILDHYGDALWRADQRPRAIQVWHEAVRAIEPLIVGEERPDLPPLMQSLKQKINTAVRNEQPPIAPIASELPPR